MATDEKKIIEIVVKTTGAADIKKLASELAFMRKEARIVRTEIKETNKTLSGFGDTWKTVGKAFGAGLVLTQLVKSSEVVQDLTKNVQDLAGEFIDASFQALGFTSLLDDEFWMTAKQGVRDLASGLGAVNAALKEAREGSKNHPGWALVDWAGSGGLAGIAWDAYAKDMKFDAASILDVDAMKRVHDEMGYWSAGGDEALKAAFAMAKKIAEVSAESAERLREERQQAREDLEWLMSFSKRERRDDSAIKLNAIAMEAHASFKLIKVDVEDAADSMLRLTEQSANFQHYWEEIATTTYSWGEALDNAIAYMRKLNELQGDLSNQAIVWSDALTYAFKGVLTGELHNTRDALKSILTDMRSFYAEMAARAAAAEVFEYAKVLFPGLTKSANGNAFDDGRIIPMAKGGIVTSPTMFPMANGLGLMGEAGPEAVMPLKRGRDGRLGVSSGASKIVIENHGQPMTADVVRGRDDETRIVLRAAQMGADMAIAEVNRSFGSGYGSTATTFSRTYGLRRR